MSTNNYSLPLSVYGIVIFIMLGITTQTIASQTEGKGFQASSDPGTDATALLARFGELISRERAYQETIQQIVLQRGSNSPYQLEGNTLNLAIGDDFLALYDQTLPHIEALGQDSRRSQLALRVNPDIQAQLTAGNLVEGINAEAVNNVIAHYKIAIENMEFDLRQLLLAESHMIGRAARELSEGVDANGRVNAYAGFVRASNLLSAVRQIKGFVQPRCSIEADARKQATNIRYDIEDKFLFDTDNQLQVNAPAIYDAADAVAQLAVSLNADGSHCG